MGEGRVYGLVGVSEVDVTVGHSLQVAQGVAGGVAGVVGCV